MKHFLRTRQPVWLSLSLCWRGVEVDPLGIGDTTWPCSVRVLVERGGSRVLFGGYSSSRGGVE